MTADIINFKERRAVLLARRNPAQRYVDLNADVLRTFVVWTMVGAMLAFVLTHPRVA